MKGVGAFHEIVNSMSRLVSAVVVMGSDVLFQEIIIFFFPMYRSKKHLFIYIVNGYNN